jgi:hypothetical protein
MLFSATATLAPQEARAQSPCVVQNVFNFSGCPINLCLYDAAGVVNCYFIPAGGVTPIVLGAFVPVGVVSAGGFQYPFAGLPAPGCSPCYTPVAPAVVCCVTVCYDQRACTFTINACPVPCLP